MSDADRRDVKNATASPAGGIDGELLGDGRELQLDRLAHEIRTPLAAIQSMAEALAGGHLGPMENPRHASYVASIAATAKHALAVFETMQTHGQARQGAAVEEPAPVDVVSLASEVVLGMSVLAARSGVRLDVRRGETGIAAFVRATDLRQMLINLVSNGIGHAGGGASVTVAAGRAGSGAWVEVADNGAGIPAPVLERLEAGAPLDGEDGVDLRTRVRFGLTLTRALAEANGGRLEIATGNGGTRVRITLPAC